MKKVYIVIDEFWKRNIIDKATMKPIEGKDQKDEFMFYQIGGVFETDPKEKAEAAAKRFEGIIKPCDDVPYFLIIKVVIREENIFI